MSKEKLIKTIRTKHCSVDCTQSDTFDVNVCNERPSDWTIDEFSDYGFVQKKINEIKEKIASECSSTKQA